MLMISCLKTKAYKLEIKMEEYTMSVRDMVNISPQKLESVLKKCKSITGEAVLILKYHKNPEIINLLKKYEAKLEYNHKFKKNNHDTLLFLTLCTNIDDNIRPEIIQECIDNGADANATYNGMSIFYAVCMNNSNIEVIRLLIASGADVNASYLGTPLLLALCTQKNPNLELIKLLIESGADVNEIVSDMPILLAICKLRPNLDVIKLLINSRTNINDIYQGCSLLAALCLDKKLNINVVRFFIEKGAKIIINQKEKTQLLSLSCTAKVCIIKYYDVLSMKWKQTHFVDDYGITIVKDWYKELQYFLVNVVPFENKKLKSFITNIFGEKGDVYDDKYKPFLKEIDKFYNEVAREMEKQNNGMPVIKTGVDYENYVESLLLSGGFEVARTPTTGDQGVDLVAEKNGIRIAIQCKYYSKPVGNKAVQEVIAGRDFYNCRIACVVSNNSFTPAARKIANVSSVLLLNDNQIVAKLDEIVG